MKTLIFASNNQHKADEINAIVGSDFNIRTLKEAGIHLDTPEPHLTLAENAREKSMALFQLQGCDCFSEDSGLEVEALNGAPGVRSARYAGEHATAEDNIDKLLREMQGIKNRKARFITVISLMLDGKEYVFEGECAGTITEEVQGSKGFGYDPVFLPEGQSRTFAEMSMEEKAAISHRKKATDQMAAFLHQHFS